ncbi:MAG: STAS domain-containing protein [Rhodobacterales bacterium]|nr:STAS domain-containing protein [Rhodobacterales bacterium]
MGIQAVQHAVSERQGVTIVALQGDIDLECSIEARRLLLGAVEGSDRIVVDLSGVTLLDSSGVASLLEAFQAARRDGKPFVLAAVGDQAYRVLRLARLDSVFDMAGTVEAGIRQARQA